MPEGDISKNASIVKKLEISRSKGERSLCHNGHPVKSITKEQAFLAFIDYITRITGVNKDDNAKNIPVFIGHNSIVFDIPCIYKPRVTRNRGAVFLMLYVHFVPHYSVNKILMQL